MTAEKDRAPFAPRLLTLSLLALLAGCADANFSTLDPAGPSARAVSQLWWIMLTGAVVLFVITSVVLVAAFFPVARKVLTPKRLVLWGGLVAPTIVLTALVITAFILGERLLVHRTDADHPRIAVVAQQFAWRFHYPGFEGSTLGRLHIRAGEPVQFVVTSEDVIHSFWVPRLGGKIDAIPGHQNFISLQADKPGTFGGICAEFCGQGHPLMMFEVIAHAPEDYDAALASELARTKPSETRP